MRTCFTIVTPVVCGLIAPAAALHAQPRNYTIGPAPGARLALTVEKTGLLRGKKHLFLFEKYEGKLSFDAKNPAAASVQLTIDSRSLVCKDDWVSAKDLKSVQKTALEDMLDAERSPAMTFSSAAVKAAAADGEWFDVQGTLTIRGRAKPSAVRVRLPAAGRGEAEMKLEGSSIIRITDYGLKPPSAVLGAIGTKDEMTLAFTVVARRE